MSIYDDLYSHRGFSNTQKLILSLIDANSTVLELGPASGYMTQVLKETKYCTVDAIEVDASSGQLAQSYCRKLLLGSIEAPGLLQQLTGPYDYIIAADVLEHLRHPGQTLQLLKSMLKATGKLLMSVPNVAYWRVRLDLLRGKFDYADSGIMDRTHLHFFTRATATRMIDEAGFLILNTLVAEPDKPGLGKLKSVLKQKLATLFSGNFIFVATPRG